MCQARTPRFRAIGQIPYSVLDLLVQFDPNSDEEEIVLNNPWSEVEGDPVEDPLYSTYETIGRAPDSFMAGFYHLPFYMEEF